MKIILNLTQILCLVITFLLAIATPAASAPLPFGTQISLNGQPWAVAWSQWQVDATDKVYIGITDAGITQLLGVELLDSENVAKQPVKWLFQPTPTPLLLNTRLNRGHRYLDVTELAQKAGWQLKILGNTLSINTPAAQAEAIYLHRLLGSDRPTVERNILWAPGLRWRQQYIDLGASHFPVVWLEIDLHTPGLVLKPIWSDPNTLIGTAPLIQIAESYGAAAAINGGFFNRHERLPLGAIRRDGKWRSSPILNRGAIAWNDLGQVKVGHLSLKETLTTFQDLLPILDLNSGYVQAGISRYTSDWGATYTPLNDSEIIVVVQNHQVTAQLSGGVAGKTAFSIPSDGYLLVIRDDSAAANSLPIGTIVSLNRTTVPSDFADYPQILGAGPLLVQNHQIVLDAKAEKFSTAFIKETAPRSAIGTTTAGTLLMVAVHNRSGGVGPTLAEVAEILQQIGCIDALNLDGGSSTSLYLGGQLLDRLPSTAARIHNSIGVFVPDL